MFFFLKYQVSGNSPVKVTHLGNGDHPVDPQPGMLYIGQGVQCFETIDMQGGTLLLLGDPVCDSRKSLKNVITYREGKFDEQGIYEHIKGHFYWFFIHPAGVRCGTSFGAIFPIYYQKEKDCIAVSSSSFFLAKAAGRLKRSRRNLLERLLFNYPFFDSTWWEGIHLLDAHRYLDLEGERGLIAGHFDLHACLGKVELNNRDSLDYLAHIFGEEAELFFPHVPFAISMTGGFDGRTLVAAACKAELTFFPYGFGRPGNSDVIMPKKQAQQLGLDYFPIWLDESYVQKESLCSALSFMALTEFNGNFGRPHYEFAARMLAEKTQYILTGNFGSELFRALHQPGVMLNRSTIQVFSDDSASWKDSLKKTTAAWDASFFKNELDALIADLEVFLQRMQGYEPNHRFYYFVFSEIARKYFGPELIMQSHYLRNRTPYLNLRFFRELNRTCWAGVHSALFEKNKNRRMKGQMFYATYLRQACPPLYWMPTNKGYRPADVLQTWRMPLLLWKIARRKFLAADESDGHSVEAFFRKFHSQLRLDISQDSLAPFFQKQLTRSVSDIEKGKDCEKWIKFYSIAAGWQHAKLVNTPVNCLS
jgi:hypothetical protein